VTHYQTDRKGVPVSLLIADMAYPHLKSARDKLVRDHPERIGEIAAMTAELHQRDLDYEAAKRLFIDRNPELSGEAFDGLGFPERTRWIQMAKDAAAT
jgi:hypothetical protein